MSSYHLHFLILVVLFSHLHHFLSLLCYIFVRILIVPPSLPLNFFVLCFFLRHLSISILLVLFRKYPGLYNWWHKVWGRKEINCILFLTDIVDLSIFSLYVCFRSQTRLCKGRTLQCSVCCEFTNRADIGPHGNGLSGDFRYQLVSGIRFVARRLADRH